MNLEERLYTSTEVAEILGVSLRSIYRYLEEGKLRAEVKTATGRHRFTKQDILSFLYPATRSVSVSNDAVNNNAFGNTSVSIPKPVSPAPPQKAVPEDMPVTQNANIDWLKKFKETTSPDTNTKDIQNSVPVAQPLQEVSQPMIHNPIQAYTVNQQQHSALASQPSTLASQPSVYASKAPAPVPQTSVVPGVSQPSAPTPPSQVATTSFTSPSKQYLYYRSSIEGLIDIAHNIDKAARKAGVEYMSTLSAGLSLHQPLKKHFSLLHTYVKPTDVDYFERSLGLEKSDELNAQLCLVVIQNTQLFNNKEEIHGLYVVSRKQLKQDFIESGEEDLVHEMSRIFS